MTFADQEEFALTDRNKDGQLTLLELHKAIRAYDPAGIDFSNDGIIEWFKDLDTDSKLNNILFEVYFGDLHNVHRVFPVWEDEKH